MKLSVWTIMLHMENVALLEVPFSTLCFFIERWKSSLSIFINLFCVCNRSCCRETTVMYMSYVYLCQAAIWGFLTRVKVVVEKLTMYLSIFHLSVSFINLCIGYVSSSIFMYRLCMYLYRLCISLCIGYVFLYV